MMPLVTNGNSSLGKTDTSDDSDQVINEWPLLYITFCFSFDTMVTWPGEKFDWLQHDRELFISRKVFQQSCEKNTGRKEIKENSV